MSFLLPAQPKASESWSMNSCTAARVPPEPLRPFSGRAQGQGWAPGGQLRAPWLRPWHARWGPTTCLLLQGERIKMPVCTKASHTHTCTHRGLMGKWVPPHPPEFLPQATVSTRWISALKHCDLKSVKDPAWPKGSAACVSFCYFITKGHDSHRFSNFLLAEPSPGLLRALSPACSSFLHLCNPQMAQNPRILEAASNFQS